MGEREARIGAAIGWVLFGIAAVLAVVVLVLVLRAGTGDRDDPAEVARRERFQAELHALRSARAAKRAATRQREDELATNMVVKAAAVEETCSGPMATSVRRKIEAQGLRYSDVGCQQLAARCADAGIVAYRAVIAGCPPSDDCIKQAADASGRAFEQCFTGGAAELIE